MSRNARIGIGLDRVIHRAAGPKLLAERRKMGRIGPGKVGVSPAFGVGRRTGAGEGDLALDRIVESC